MSTQLQLRRGPAATVASTTGAAGELIVDTTNWSLYLQDGSTAGGHLIGGSATPALSSISAAVANNTINNGTYAQEWRFEPNGTQYYSFKLTDTDSAGVGGSLFLLQGYAGNTNSIITVTDEAGTIYLDISNSGNFVVKADTTIGGALQAGAADGSGSFLTYVYADANEIALKTGGYGLSIASADGKWNINSTGTGAAGNVLTIDSGGLPYWAAPATSGTVTDVTATSPLSSTGGATPDISISQAGAASDGYLSSTDWNTFNNKGSGTVTSVTATGPLSSTGGATPDISISQATTSTNGYLSSTDWNTFNSKGNGTVTSVAALTLGTTGTDLSSTVANGTTTPVITLNVPTASASNRGALSSTDWSTFNSKAASGANSNITSLSGITGAITTPTYIDFATGATVTPAVGRLTWDAADGTLQFGLAGGNVNLQIGQETVIYVHNNTGSPLTDGQVVYITGSTGERPTVALADASSEATSSKTIGVVTETIANGANGFITFVGLVHGLNTNSYNEGDALWLSTTAGQFTSTRPTAPDNSVFIGWVVKKAGGNGSIFVNIQNGYELDELHNVLITNPVTAGELLTYNGTVWVNAAPAWPIPQVQGPTSVSTSTTVNWANKDVTKLTLTGNTTVTNSGAVDGQKMILQVIQGGSGGYSISFTSETKFGTSFTSITLSSTVGTMDMIGLVYSAVNSKYNIVSFAAGY